jgi:hypothetical protein
VNILFTGKPNKGSWQIRAVQMADGLGACIPFATVKQCRKADFIIAVKRVPEEVLQAIRDSGRPWAWDVVDPYPQPECSAWSREQAIHWMRLKLRAMKPTVAVWATQSMQQDIEADGVVIPHHSRPGIAVNPIREELRVVGYDGAPAYLDHWAPALSAAAKRVGATFVDRVGSLAQCDVVVALRGGRADCYVTRHWKSNVKLANAHGSGTPFIGQPDSGYMETAAGGECWVQSPDQLDSALASLLSKVERERISKEFLSKAISLRSCQDLWRRVAMEAA